MSELEELYRERERILSLLKEEQERRKDPDRTSESLLSSKSLMSDQ
jgi:hypothetical protein